MAVSKSTSLWQPISEHKYRPEEVPPLSDPDKNHLAHYNARCERRINEVARMADANEPQAETIREIGRLTRHGHKFADLIIRKDGVEYRFEADWVVTLLRDYT